jgi:hypothetical protein
MEITEKKFKDWCNKNKYYCKKLLTHTSQGKGGNQESDFLVANFKGVYFVECKERKGDLFEFEGLTQERKLKLAMKKTDKIKSYILVNFIEHKTLIFLSLENYLQLKETSKFSNGKQRKSINVKSIGLDYKFTWLNLKF